MRSALRLVSASRSSSCLASRPCVSFFVPSCVLLCVPLFFSACSWAMVSIGRRFALLAALLLVFYMPFRPCVSFGVLPCVPFVVSSRLVLRPVLGVSFHRLVLSFRFASRPAFLFIVLSSRIVLSRLVLACRPRLLVRWRREGAAPFRSALRYFVLFFYIPSRLAHCLQYDAVPCHIVPCHTVKREEERDGGTG